MAAAILFPHIAAAQNPASYPAKPVRVIVPSSPGGGIDIPARMFAQLLSDSLQRPLVVDNRAGAGGVIAHELVARSVPDGYTLLAAAPIFTIASALNPNLPYDPLKDFVPISLVTTGPYLLLVNPAFPAKSVNELIAFANAKPGALNIGVSTGGGSHLAAALFASMAGIRVALIPYKGSGPVAIDTISGQLHMFFGNVGSSTPLIKSGRLRVLAVSSAQRSTVLPNLPAIAEVVPGFDVTFWHGWLAPARTPAGIIKKLNAELAKAVRSPEVVRKLAEDGGEPVGSTPEKFRELISAEIPRWRKTVKEAEIRVE